MLATKWINAGLMVAIATPLAAALAAGTSNSPIGENSETAARRAPLVAQVEPAPPVAAPLPETDALSETMAGGLTVATGVQYADNSTSAYYSSAPVPWSAEWYHVCEASYTSFDPDSGTYLGKDGQRHFCM